MISVSSVAILYSMARLGDKVTVVTGASSGIGRAIALAFAGEGACVVVNYNKSKDRAEEVVREIRGLSGQALAVQADIADPDAATGLVETVNAEFGPHRRLGEQCRR